MRRIFILVCLLLTTFTVTAQFGRQRQNRFGRQQPNTPPTQNQKAAMEKKAEERKAEIVKNFLDTLEADEFQKEIATQTILDYFKKTQAFMKIPFDNSTKQKDAFEIMKNEHFTELKTLFSESDNKKLDVFLDGKFDEKEERKKKKKERKRKKKKADDSEN